MLNPTKFCFLISFLVIIIGPKGVPQDHEKRIKILKKELEFLNSTPPDRMLFFMFFFSHFGLK